MTPRPTKRSEVLRRVTDLFVGEAEHFSADQTALFDSVLGQLVSHIESRAAVELSQRLAPIANAPLQTVRHLAAHDDIAVSGPILEKSERLSDDDLVAIAKTKSQAHLAKIANRARLNETVTEVLVDHGDAEVANTLAGQCRRAILKAGHGQARHARRWRRSPGGIDRPQKRHTAARLSPAARTGLRRRPRANCLPPRRPPARTSSNR